MSRAEEPVSINAVGDQDHPAFAVAAVNRSHGTPRALFQTDLMHSDTVTLSIETATRKRDLNRDWVHPRKSLIEVEMSLTQWGALVSSIGGSGVPVTIRSREAEPMVPGLPYEPRTAENTREVRETVTRLLSRVQTAMDDLDAAEDNKAGVKERRDIRRNLRSAIVNAAGNAQFAVDSLSNAAESLVQQARSDIETQIMQIAVAHGIEPSVSLPRLELTKLDARAPASTEHEPAEPAPGQG